MVKHVKRVGKLQKRSLKVLGVFHKILARLERHSAKLLTLAEQADVEIATLQSVKDNALEQHKQNNAVMDNIKKIVG